MTPVSIAGADDNPSTDDLTHQCLVVPAVTSGTTESGVPAVVAGETVTVTHRAFFDEGEVFQDSFFRPDGTTYWSSYMETTLPANDLVLDPASVQFSIGGTAVPTTAGAAPVAGTWVLDTDTTTTPGSTIWRVLFPGDVALMTGAEDGAGDVAYTVPAGGEWFEFSYRLTVPASPTIGVGEVEQVVECFLSVSTGPSNRDTNRLDGAVSLIEPLIEVAKSSAELVPVYSPGGTVEYTVEVSVPEIDANGFAVADAYDTLVIDTLPPGIVPVTPLANGGVWDASALTITWLIAGPIAAGTSMNLVYDAVIDVDAAPGDEFTNTVTAVTTGLPGDVANESVAPEVADDETVTIASEVPGITKMASVETIDIGVPFEYTVTITLPANSSYENMTVLDTLPDGIQFNSYISEACTGTVCPAAIATLAPTGPRADGSTVVGWYPNSMGLDTGARTLTFVYEAEILDTYIDGSDVSLLDTFENTVEVLWNNVDRLGDQVPSTTSQPLFDGSTSSDESVVYNRPILTVEKDADRGTYWDFSPGEKVSYSVIITNVGQMDAVNIDFLDTMSLPGVVTPGTVFIDGVACASCPTAPLSGTIPGPLSPGAFATVTYEVTPTGGGNYIQQNGIDNTFSIPSYDDPEGTEYTENPSDDYELLIGFPNPTISKGIPAQGLASRYLTSSNLGTPVTFEITVGNVGNGTFYNPVVKDNPPVGLCLIPGTGTNGVTDDGVDDFTLNTTIAPGGTFTFEVTYEVCGEVAEEEEVINNVEVTGEDFADNRDQANQLYHAEADAPLWFTDPSIEVQKTPDLDAGATIPQTDLDTAGPPWSQGEWTITISNTGSTTAYDIAVDDVMPETFEYLPGTSIPTFIFGTGPHSLTDNSATSPAATVAGYVTEYHAVVDQIDPGQIVRIRIPFIQNGAIPADLNLELQNTVYISNPNMEVDPDAHSDDGWYGIVPLRPGPKIDKAIDIPSGVPGTDVEYTLTVTFPDSPLVDAYDVVIQDLLPDGLALVNEPAPGPMPGASGWTITCVSGPCGNIEVFGDYLGSQAQTGFPAGTDMFWWFGDVDLDPAVPIVVEITFAAEVETTFDTGFGVIDGVDEPLINWVRPIFNDTDQLGAPPAGLPVPNTFDFTYPRAYAPFDVSTPSLRLGKLVEVDGQQLDQVNVGDRLDYKLSVVNVGSADAFVIQLEDDMGLGRLRPISGTGANLADWDFVIPAGWSCSLAGSPIALSCTFAGPLAGSGGTSVIEYSAFPPHADDIVSHNGTAWDPERIENEAITPSYYGTPTPTAGDLEYSYGSVKTSTWVYTPQAETEVRWSECPVNMLVGSDVDVIGLFGNGDWFYEGPNDGDLTLFPYPDIVSNPDAGMGFAPVATITIPPSVQWVPGQVTATGEYVGQPFPSWAYNNSTTPVPFPDPDIETINADGSVTLTWNNLDDFPHALDNDTEWDFAFHLAIIVATTVADGSDGRLVESTLQFLDGDGLEGRGTNVNNQWNYFEPDRQGCPGGGPSFNIQKRPDKRDDVRLAANEIYDFTIWVNISLDEVTNVTFDDLLPAGLDYLGDDPADPDYAVSTISPALPGGATLESYYQSTTTSASDIEKITWGSIPVLPKGQYQITVPFRVDDPVLTPFDWVENSIVMTADEGIRQDPGHVYLIDAGAPTVTKKINRTQGLWGDKFAFQVDIAIPALFEGTDIFVIDHINEFRDDNGDVVDAWPVTATANVPQQIYSQPPIEFDTYLDQASNPIGSNTPVPGACYSGCTFGGVDDITPITAGPAPLSTTSQFANAQVNNRIAWYLGDIERDPEGEDRYLSFTYLVDTADYATLRDMLMGTTTGSYGWSTPSYGDIDLDAQLTEDVRVSDYINRVYLKDTVREYDVEDFNLEFHNDWTFDVDRGGLANTISEHSVNYEVQFPWVEFDKECEAPGGGEPEYTPAGTANVECTVTVTNTSAFDAYNVVVNDIPAPDSTGGLWNWNGAWAGATTQYATPVSGASFLDGSAFLQTAAADYPTSGATWKLDLDAGDSVELTYQFRIDGWSGLEALPNMSNYQPTYAPKGVWENTATLEPWNDKPIGGNTINGADSDSESVEFVAPYLHLHKRPFIPDLLSYSDEDRSPINQHPNYQRDSDYEPLITDPATTDLLEPATKLLDYRYQAEDYRSYVIKRNYWSINSTSCNSWIGWNCNTPSAWGPAWQATPNEPYSFVIDMTVSSMAQFDELILDDVLPFGWEYSPGSARLVEADWAWNPARLAPSASDAPGTGYVIHSAPDPTIAPPPAGAACNTATGVRSELMGESLRWKFIEGDPVWGQPWDVRYLDTRDTVNQPDSFNHVVLLFDAIPTSAAAGCAESSDTEVELFRNHSSLTGITDVIEAGFLESDSETTMPLSVPWSLDKAPDAGFIPDGGTSPYDIVFVNDDDEALTDVTFTDVLTLAGNAIIGTTPMPYTCGTATTTGGTNFTEVSCVEAPAGTLTVVWHYDSIASGESVLIEMPLTAPLDEISGVTYPNTVTVSSPDMPTDLTDDGHYEVIAPSAPQPVTKKGNPNPATINEEITYTLSWRQLPRQVFLDLYYLDTVPDGLTFTGYEGISCTGSCPPNSAVEMTEIVNADGTTSLGWWFGDLPGTAKGATWTMTYTAVVDDTYTADGSQVEEPDDLVNVVDGYSNDVDVWPNEPVTTIPSEPSSDFTSTDSHTLTIVEPLLELDKTAVSSVAPIDGTAVLTYTVSVTNVGGGSAYDLRLEDLPGPVLENIMMAPTTYPGSVIVDGWTPQDPTISWFLPVLAAGDTATFTYTADILDTYASLGLFVAPNDLEATEYRGRDLLYPEEGDRIYDDLPPIHLEVPLHAPIMDIEKYSGGCTAEVAPTNELDSHTWCLVITNFGSAPGRTPRIVDVLPTGWTYDAGSTVIVGQPTAEPAVTTNVNGLDVLTWDLADMAATDVVEIQFTAQPALGSPEVVTNEATVVIFDEFGDPYGPEIAGASDDDTAMATLKPFGLEIMKTTDAFDVDDDGPDDEPYPFLPYGTLGDDGIVGTADDGAPMSWTITVTNPINSADGIDNGLTELVITECVPAPLIYVPGTATSSAAGFTEVSVTPAGCGTGTEIVWTVPALAENTAMTISVPNHVPSTVSGATNPFIWYVNDAQVVANEIPDLVANHAKARFYRELTGFDLALRKTIDSVSAPVGPGVGSVTFMIEVFNQGDPVEDFDVTDYIDSAFFEDFDPALNPAGSTAGSQTLPYLWTATDPSAPVISIDGPLGVDESVTFPITLVPSVDWDVTTNLENHAEISRFDDDGDPSNGDSDPDNADNPVDGPLVDNDSTPDQDNTDPLEDDEIEESDADTSGDGVIDEDDHDVASLLPPVFDLALRKTVDLTATSVPVFQGDDVTFVIEVLNQGNTHASGISLVDYVDQSMWEPFDALDNAPGTTTGSQSLPYTWVAAGTDGAVTITGSLAPGESVLVPVVLTATTPLAAGSIDNLAEITAGDAVDGAGDPVLGSDDNPLTDIDSDPDATNDDPLLDDEVDNGPTDDGTPDEDDHDIASVTTANYDLALIKILDSVDGTEATFTIRVTNQGSVDSGEVTVTDVLPAGLGFVSADNGGAETAAGSNVVEWTIPNIPAIGDNFIDLEIVVEVTDLSLAPYENNAAITSIPDEFVDEDSDPEDDNDDVIDRFDGDETIDEEVGDTDDHDIATFDPGSYDLALIKFLSGSDGTEATFTIRVSNQGDIDSGQITVNDVIPAGLGFVSADNGGTETAAGSNVVEWTIPNIPATGDSFIDLQVVVEVTNLALAPFENNAAITSIPDEFVDEDSDPSDDNDDVIDRFDGDETIDEEVGDTDDHDIATFDPGSYDLALIKFLSGSDGTEATFTIRVSNQGGLDSGEITVNDVLPAGLGFVSADNGGTETAAGSNVVEWTIPNVAAGGDIDLEIVVEVTDLSLAPYENNAAITSIPDEFVDEDSDPEDDNDDVIDRFDGDETIDEEPGDTDDHDIATFDPGSYDLALIKLFETGGDMQGTFIVRVINQGGIDSGQVTIADTLPAGTVFVSADNSGTETGAGSGVVEWVVDNIEAGASVDLRITLEVTDPEAGPFQNSSAITSIPETFVDEDSDPNDDNDDVIDRGDGDETIDEEVGDTDDHDIATFTLAEIATPVDVELTKTVTTPAPYVVGDTVSYTITVENKGPGDATMVEVTDTMPTGMAFEAADNGGANDGAVTTWLIESLPAGTSIDLVISARISAGAAGSLVNHAEVTDMVEPDIDSTPGEDPLDLTTGPNEDDEDEAELTVVPTSLPFTGTSVFVTLMTALLLIALGMTLIVGTRRRRAAVN